MRSMACPYCGAENFAIDIDGGRSHKATIYLYECMECGSPYNSLSKMGKDGRWLKRFPVSEDVCTHMERVTVYQGYYEAYGLARPKGWEERCDPRVAELGYVDWLTDGVGGER